MAKSNYLPGLLFAAAVCLCVYALGDYIKSEKLKVKSEKGLSSGVIANSPFDVIVNGSGGKDEGSEAVSPRKVVQSLYLAELGIREATGRNDGSRVEEYLAYAGLDKGNPWCAAFICWVYGQAGIANPRTGWSPSLFPSSRVIWTRERKVRSGRDEKHDNRPDTADVFGIWFADKGRIAHAGFIDAWGEKYVVTVEGNTNGAGLRDGDGVYRKRRLIGSVYQVAGWVAKSKGKI